ncbi:uncharacterized protein NPIL_145341 [Nephila pilipes]|uniref:Uncharacterized protein n=1 Tax=Nephila pilipes TaxID=299642 RepID=A0A8X6TSI9_NEPPI|nr:uncharacterized protein NPIL_145341 [Nephila pilipes]
MRLLLSVLILPSVLGAEIICSNSTACPEGSKCCTTFEGEIRCCDVRDFDSNSDFARSRKPLKIVSAAPSHHYTNTSEIQNGFNECFYCKGTCCGSNCCPYTYASCCKNICCNTGYQCCGNTRQNKAEWCCKRREKCATFTTGLCLDKSSSLVPSFLVSLSIAVTRIFCFKMRLLLLAIILPCAFGAETFCSNDTACPEGTKCCTTHDGQIRCCNIRDSGSDPTFVRSTSPLKAVPADPPHKFSNASGYFDFCITGHNCVGPCCDDGCCPLEDGNCCNGICCAEGYQCCGGTSDNKEEWCCRWRQTCATYATGICFNKGSIFVPSMFLLFSIVTIRLWFCRNLF